MPLRGDRYAIDPGNSVGGLNFKLGGMAGRRWVKVFNRDYGANSEHRCPESTKSNLLLIALSVILAPECSDVDSIMNWSDRLFIVAAFLIFGIAGWEVLKQYQRIKELHRTDPAKWPRVPVLPAAVDLYEKSDRRP